MKFMIFTDDTKKEIRVIDVPYLERAQIERSTLMDNLIYDIRITTLLDVIPVARILSHPYSTIMQRGESTSVSVNFETQQDAIDYHYKQLGKIILTHLFKNQDE